VPVGWIALDDGAAVNDKFDFEKADEAKAGGEEVGPEEVAVVVLHEMKFTGEGVEAV